MRIATYEHDGATRARIVEADAVRPLDDGIGRISNRIVAGAEPAEFGEPRRRG